MSRPASTTARRPTPAPGTLPARFVADRGWRPEVAAGFRLHSVNRNGRRRIRFPFVRGGQVIWWQDRALGEEEPKYQAPAGHRQQPYAMDVAGALESAEETGVAWVVEGLPDVLALAHLADPGQVPAVIGVPGVDFAYFPALAAALAGLTVALVADADAAGERLRHRAGQVLTDAGACVVHVEMPAGVHDIDDLRRRVGCRDDAAFLAALGEAYEAGLKGHSCPSCPSVGARRSAAR